MFLNPAIHWKHLEKSFPSLPQNTEFLSNVIPKLSMILTSLTREQQQQKSEWMKKYMERRNDFIYLLFFTLSHLKHMFPTSRCVSKATEIKDFCRTAPSTPAFKQTSELKSASVFGKMTRGPPIIQKASCPETSSSAVAGSQTGLPLEWASRDSGRHPPHGPTHAPRAHRAPWTVISWVCRGIPHYTARAPTIPSSPFLITHHPTDTF